MTHITEKELDHLAKLAALKLSSEEKKTLLPQLENIIGFVGQLQSCDVEIDPADDIDLKMMQCNTGLKDCLSTEDFLKNVSHPTESGMIELKTNTNQA